MQVVPVYLLLFQRNLLLNCVSQPLIAKKSIKPPILTFKIIQGLFCFLRQSKASVRLSIND